MRKGLSTTVVITSRHHGEPPDPRIVNSRR
jgi:hypothetical protein